MNYTTRIFPTDCPSKAAARRDCAIVAQVAIGAGAGRHEIRATSQSGRPCVTVGTDTAARHRRLVAQVRRQLPYADLRSNPAATRALAQS